MPGPIEIDEACLYRVRKGNHGRLEKIIYWVFGLRCRTAKKVTVYLVVHRSRECIVPLIKLHKTPIRSIIYSDCYSAYFNNRRTPKDLVSCPIGLLPFWSQSFNRICQSD